MFVRQVKRKCSVRGCKNTECFAISRTRELGNTVIICKKCLGNAIKAINEIDPKTKSNIPDFDNMPIPPLFFNQEALVIADDVTDTEESEENDNDAVTEGDTDINDYADLKCPVCGKVCASRVGLQSHLRACNKKASEGNEY